MNSTKSFLSYFVCTHLKNLPHQQSQIPQYNPKLITLRKNLSMSVKEKQKYLRQQILSQNYDVEAFQLFLEKFKPEEALDIQAWTLQDLKRAVTGFKAQYNQPTPSPIVTVLGPSIPTSTQQPVPRPQQIRYKTVSAPSLSQTPSLSPTKQSPPPPPPPPTLQHLSKSSTQKPTTTTTTSQLQDQQFIDNVTNQQTYIKTIQCNKTEMSPLSDLNVVVQMKKYQKSEGGLFEQDYVTYSIDTPDQNWSVMRRYNDFVWFREILEKLHPGLPIPPIPKKGAFRNFDESHLIRRMNALEGFINKVLTMRELKAEPLVYGFIRASEPVEWMKLKKEYAAVEEKVKVQRMRKTKGKVRLAIEPKITKLANQYRQTFFHSQPRMNKIYKDSKQIVINLESNAKLFEGIGTTFTELSEQSNRFNKQIEINVDRTNTELFKMMSSLMRDLARTTMDQAQAYKQYMYNLYKYQLHHLIVLNQSLKKVDQLRQQYTQTKSKLKRTKQKLYQDKNLSKWNLPTLQYQKLSKDKNAYDKAQCLNLMLPKQTEHLQQLREQYALLNGQFYEEVMRYYEENPLYLSRSLLELAKKQSSVSGTNLMIWADIMTYFTNFNSGAKLIRIPGMMGEREGGAGGGKDVKEAKEVK